mmetsp:Transcript_117907/g.270489  ORF Transcript_117907/g.270489 Transcript_117907/m.270489 type:complete len:80 (-) Transcript_117907:66-305(-)
MSGSRLVQAKAPGCPRSQGNQLRCHALDSEAYNMCLSCPRLVFAGSSRGPSGQGGWWFWLVRRVGLGWLVGHELGTAWS